MAKILHKDGAGAEADEHFENVGYADAAPQEPATVPEENHDHHIDRRGKGYPTENGWQDLFHDK